MDWKKIAPWNWFKEEEPPAPGAFVPARLDAASDPLATFRREMERLFDGSGMLGRAPSPLRPSVDIAEGKKAYTVRAELPGVGLEDIAIQVDGRTLLIRAEKRQEREEEDESYHCAERYYGAVQRVLSLPDDADGETIEAKFRNGVLKVRIPKHPARGSLARGIEIQRG